MASEVPAKLYYRIGEVASALGVEPHVLRYWETEFSSVRPQKSSRGQRVYSHRDLERLRRIKQLLHVEGYTIAGARKKMRTKEEPQVPPEELTKAEQKATAAQSDADRLRGALTSLRSEIRAEIDRLS